MARLCRSPETAGRAGTPTCAVGFSEGLDGLRPETGEQI